MHQRAARPDFSHMHMPHATVAAQVVHGFTVRYPCSSKRPRDLSTTTGRPKSCYLEPDAMGSTDVKPIWSLIGCR